MVQLIKKDFISSKIFLGIATIVIPFITCIMLLAMMDDFGGVALGAITLLTVFACAITSIIPFLLDTTTGIETTFAGFPIERSEIVLARYLSAYLLNTYALLLIVVTIWVLNALVNPSDNAFEILLSIRGIIGIYVFLTFLLSFFLPYILKFGASKGSVYYMATMMILGFLDPIYTLLNNLSSGLFVIDLSIFKRIFEASILFIRFLPASEVYLLLISVVLVVVSSSIYLSIKLYTKRDL